MAGVRPRLHANLEALRTLRQIQAETRPATADEQRVLARWSGWGAIAQQAFHPSYADEFGAEQAELRSLLDRREYAAARRSTLNAYYTDASLVQVIWDAVSDLGVQGGNILEPGCGSGNFLGFAPQDVHMLGVELDSTSAAISALLYPHAQVRNESFAETVSPDSVFDAAVGNVPFGDHALYDSRHNPARLSIHNHFIVKSLDLVKPGGVVAMVTSHYTMDSQSTTARSEIIKRADILGVVRLPSSAHQAAAGTKVVTDVVLLRKRSAGEPSAHLASITNGLRDLGAEDPDCDAPVWANTYFDDHSEHLLGEATWRMGQYGPELDVVGPAQGLGERLRHVLGEIVQTAKAEGLAAVPAPEGTERLELADLASAKYEGLLQVDQAGHLTKMRHGRPEPYIPSKEKAELVKLLRMRDTVRDLLDAQNATAVETPHILDLRKQLNEQYDAYVAAHGYINRRSVNKNGVASRPFQGGFRHDPLSSYVYGLEHYDTETGTGSKMEVFYQRVLNPSREVTRADTPQDALYVCLREVGEVDLDRIASLLGEENRDKAREALGDLVYTDPTDGRLVSAPEYLSGDVRVKLRQAREAAELDPALAVNVRALEDVQRPELTAAEIIPQLGAAWIDDSYVQQFAREVLENDLIEVQHAGHNVWWVSDHGKGSPLATEMFGTKRRSANELLASALAQKRVEVFDTVREEGRERQVLNEKETDAARAKVDELRERFSEWVWEDPERTATLVEHYNATYNSVRLRSYDDEVDLDRDFPGLATDTGFEPRHHQIAAVERILAEPATLLAHGTGAGKTSEMIMASMEMRRLGQARKPALVVPNNVIEQFAAEFPQRYPGARVLVADKKKIEPKYRQEFLSQVAMGDWDAVIFTHQQFEKVPMGFEVRKAYLEQQVDSMQEWYEDLVDQEAARANVKQAERMVIKAQERLARHLDGNHDVGITFEHTGLDALLVDEAHLFKNATVRSNILDAAKQSSARADDMMMKFDYLRERDGKLVMATATPVANSVAELWVFLRYLYPEWLRERGLEDFDRWASTFGLVETVAELDEANEIRQRERFSKFCNVPELLLAWAKVTDAKTKEELGLPEPLVQWLDAQGVWQDGPRTVVVPPSPEQVAYHEQQIKARMKDLRHGDPWFMGQKRNKKTGELVDVYDNTLWVGNHAAANSLDRRLAPRAPEITPLAMADLHRAVEEMERFNKLDPLEREERMALYRATLGALASGTMPQDQVPEWFDAMALGLTKTDVAAQMLHQVWEDNKDRTFLDRRTGQPHERPGALQLVFCDSGVWNKDKDVDQYTVYTDLRERLVAMGMPREQIRFLQEADGDDRKKAELFEACRDGRVSVLIGTTVGMGVGTNVQDRAVHLLHMDCPWRPVDIEQRDGRIVRQHNQSEHVQITRLVTAESADALRWSTNARKAGFIGQILRSQVTEREIEDIDPQQADFGVTAALSANNPRQQAYSEALQKLNVVERSYKSWSQSRAASHQTLRWAPIRIKEAQAYVDQLDSLLSQRVSTKGKDFSMWVGEHTYTKRKEAGEALKEAVYAAVVRERADADQGRATAEVGIVGGVSITASIRYGQAGQFTVAVGFPDVPRRPMFGGTYASVVSFEDRADLLGANPVSLCTQLERPLSDLDCIRAEYKTSLQQEHDRQRQAQANLDRPFTKRDRLVELTKQVEDLAQELGIKRDSEGKPPTAKGPSDTQQTSATGGSAIPSAPTQTTGPLVEAAGGPSAAVTGSTDSPAPAPDSDRSGAGSHSRPSGAPQRPAGHGGGSAERPQAALSEANFDPVTYAEEALRELSARPDLKSRTRSRARLREVVNDVTEGRVDQAEALRLFAVYTHHDPKMAFKVEQLRAQVALPSLDSPGFATAMTITHTRVQTALHTPERIKGKVFQAVRDAGFSSSDGHLWTMHESWTHADRTYRLGTLMHELNQLPQAPERMPVEHREFLQEQARTAEAATDEIERVKTADTALAARVHTLRQDGYLAAAWAATQEHVATLRRSQDLSVHDIDALPVGRLRAEILVQARGLEQALDRERTEQGELSAQQRESYTERYQRACPHLDREQIRERVETSVEATEVLRRGYQVLDELDQASGNLIQGQRWALEGMVKEVAEKVSLQDAFDLITAANRIDPGEAWHREALRTDLCLPPKGNPDLARALILDQRGNSFQAYLSVHTPRQVRQVLLDHGWSAYNAVLEPRLILTGEEEERQEKFAATMNALDTLPYPQPRFEWDRWRMRAFPHGTQYVQTLGAVLEELPALGERVQELVEAQQVRRAQHLVLEHLERARAFGDVPDGRKSDKADALHLEVVFAGYEQAEELDAKLAALPQADVQARVAIAGLYWSRCPHLSLEQISEHVGVPLDELQPTGEDARMRALEMGPALQAPQAAPQPEPERTVAEVLWPLRAAVEALESRSLHSDSVLPPLRVAFKSAATALQDLDYSQAEVQELFVRANRADPQHAWAREQLRSELFYPVEDFEEGAPVLSVSAKGGFYVRAEVDYDQVPAHLWEKLDDLGFQCRKQDPENVYSLPSFWRPDTRAERVNQAITYCDEHDVAVITALRAQQRQDARQKAADRRRQEELRIIEERTPLVRAAAESSRTEGNLREAVTTIDDHLTALGLLGQSEWQGTAQAKKHELWPLREQLMRESNKRGKELYEQGKTRDTAGRIVLLRQMLAECPHMPAAELERRIEQREKLLTSQQDAQEPQDSQTHTQDSAAEVPSMPRGAFAHTPPPLEMDSPEAARDRELLGELSASWLRWRRGESPTSEHEQVLQRVRATVDARLEVKEWAPAWRLVACARLIDSHGMAAYNLSSSPDWLYEQLLQMSWQMSPEAPTDTEDALRALDEADQALSALARKDPQADDKISIAAEHLSQAQLWRHACHLLDTAEEHGADATPARRDLDDKILQEVLAEPQGALLDAMGTPADAALFEQAVGRIKSSYVHDLQTKDRNLDAVDSPFAARLTSPLFELWAQGYHGAALAVIDSANRQDPRGAWHREDVRSRLLFTELPEEQGSLVRIEHTMDNTRVLGVGKLPRHAPLRRVLKEAAFTESRKHGFWYLNRTTSVEVRTVRAGQLIQLLDAQGISHISEQRYQALAEGTAREQDVLVCSRYTQARAEALALAGEGEYKQARQVLTDYVKEMNQELVPVSKLESHGVFDLVADTASEARALAGQARQRYQKAKADGARPDELLSLLDAFAQEHPESDRVRDLESLRKRLQDKVIEGNHPLTSPARTAQSEPGQQRDTSAAHNSQSTPPAAANGSDSPEQAEALSADQQDLLEAAQEQDFLMTATVGAESLDLEGSEKDSEPDRHTLHARTDALLGQVRSGDRQSDRDEARGLLREHLVEVERVLGAQEALAALQAANRVDPAGRLDREHHRSALAMPSVDGPDFSHMVLFENSSWEPRVFLAASTPDSVREELIAQGWAGTGAACDIVMTLHRQDFPDQDLGARLARTFEALDAMPLPPAYAGVEAWRERAEVLQRTAQAQKKLRALHTAERDLLAQVDHLRDRGELRQAHDLVLEHLDALRGVGELSEWRWQETFTEVVARSYDYLDELYQAAAAVAEDDVSARRALAQRMLPRLPHLSEAQLHVAILRTAMAQNLDPRTTTPRQLIEQLLPHMPTATWERPWLRSEFLHLLPHAALDTDREQLRELFLAANNADPEGSWERERVRSQVLYPLDQPFQERPVLSVDVHSATMVRLLAPREQVDEAVFDLLDQAGMVPRSEAEPHAYILNQNVTPIEAGQAMSGLLARLDAQGVPVITHQQLAQHRSEAYDRAQKAIQALAKDGSPGLRARVMSRLARIDQEAQVNTLVSMASEVDPRGPWQDRAKIDATLEKLGTTGAKAHPEPMNVTPTAAEPEEPTTAEPVPAATAEIERGEIEALVHVVATGRAYPLPYAPSLGTEPEPSAHPEEETQRLAEQIARQELERSWEEHAEQLGLDTPPKTSTEQSPPTGSPVPDESARTKAQGRTSVSDQDREAADVAFRRAGQARQIYHYRTAIHELDRARTLDPGRDDLWRWARTVVRADQASERAGHLMRQGKFQASLASLKEASRLDPSRTQLWEQRRTQVQQAREGYRPDNPSTIARQGSSSKVRPNKPEPPASGRQGSPSKPAPNQQRKPRR